MLHLISLVTGLKKEPVLEPSVAWELRNHTLVIIYLMKQIIHIADLLQEENQGIWILPDIP